jgi:hypothetical protein
MLVRSDRVAAVGGRSGWGAICLPSHRSRRNRRDPRIGRWRSLQGREFKPDSWRRARPSSKIRTALGWYRTSTGRFWSRAARGRDCRRAWGSAGNAINAGCASAKAAATMHGRWLAWCEQWHPRHTSDRTGVKVPEDQGGVPNVALLPLAWYEESVERPLGENCRSARSTAGLVPRLKREFPDPTSDGLDRP